MKEQYAQKDIYADLLDHASKMLKPGGRVVFLWHTDDEKSEEDNRFPSHPGLEFVISSKDVLTKFRARHLVTMRKKM
jgi:tRNA G10  N-methylase Trm11